MVGLAQLLLRHPRQSETQSWSRTSKQGAVAGIVGAACVVATVFTPQLADAHGRFPQSGQIVVDPNDDSHLFVRTTYGAVITTDRAATWSWICPESVQYTEQEDPSVVIMANGTVVAGTFGGLSVSRDFGCDFARETGALDGEHISDVQNYQNHQSSVALSVAGITSTEFVVKLWETDDSAATWAALGTAPPSDFLAVSVGVAWSDQSQLYLTGRDGMEGGQREGVVFRSSDRGTTWERLAVPGTVPSGPSIEVIPFMGGVDPNDANRLVVGVVTTQASVTTKFELLVSDDAAATWRSVFEVDNGISGFAFSPDGTEVALGGPKDGLWTAPADTLNFTKVNDLAVGCLTWDTSGIYACADQFVDGYNVGLSTDEGKTFSALSELGSPCGPPTCDVDSSTTAECTSLWPAEKAELQACMANEGGGGGGGEGAGGEVVTNGCACATDTGENKSPSGALVWLAAAAAVILRKSSQRKSTLRKSTLRKSTLRKSTLRKSTLRR